MGEYLSFRRMITPVIIQVIFWLGVAACVIGGLVLIVAGAGARYGGGGQVLSGIFLLLLGPLGIRVYCELLIVFFKMLELLREISEKIGKSP